MQHVQKPAINQQLPWLLSLICVGYNAEKRILNTLLPLFLFESEIMIKQWEFEKENYEWIVLFSSFFQIKLSMCCAYDLLACLESLLPICEVWTSFEKNSLVLLILKDNEWAPHFCHNMANNVINVICHINYESHI